MVTLTPEQAGRLLKAAEGRPLMRLLVMLGVATGARLGELLALCWTDVDLDAGTVRIGWSRRIVKRRVEVKGHKTEAGYRAIVLGPVVLGALKRLHAEQAERRLALGVDYLPDAERRRARGADFKTDEYLVICKADAAASFLAAAGVPASDIAAQLGHKDAGALALKVYVHPMGEDLTRAGVHLIRSSEHSLPRRCAWSLELR